LEIQRRKHSGRWHDFNKNFRKQVNIKAKKEIPLAGSSQLCNEPTVQRNLEFTGKQQLNYCQFSKGIPFFGEILAQVLCRKFILIATRH
jgi:hypothetical protein